LAEAPAEEGIAIRVGRRSARASSRSALTPVDFAVGVLNGRAYLGYWQDVDLYDDRGGFIDVDVLPMLVFEDGRSVPYLNEYLRELGARRAVMPCLTENWWSGRLVDVEPRGYYLDVYGRFKHYIDAPEHVLHFLSLWTIGTAFHGLFSAYPYLGLMGVMRSGKTKTLTLVKLMGFNAIRSHSMSPATIYRLVESAHATLLLDEQDYLADPERRGELRTLLLGGYKKGSFVYRSEKTSSGKIVPSKFAIYSPKALANIEGLEDVLQDRTITIVMMRSVDPMITRREPDEDDPSWLELRDRLASLYLRHWREVLCAYGAALRALGDAEDYDGIPEAHRGRMAAAREFIYSRMREMWSPIIALALFFESKGVAGLLDSALQVARENTMDRLSDEVDSPEAALVYALAKVYRGDDYYPLADVLAAYKEVTGMERVRPESMGRLMKRAGLRDKKRTARHVRYFISRRKIEELARRFNVSLEDLQQYASLAEPTQSTLLPQPTQPPEGLLARAVDYAYRVRREFTVGELARELGVSVGEARGAAELLARSGVLVRVDEVTFRPAR